MRKLAIAMALASTALATPAVARDKSWYVGIEGGVMLVEDTKFDLSYDYEGQSYDFDDAFSIDHNKGVDIDLIAGYDFGLFRAEAEVGYKRAGIDDIQVSSLISDADVVGDGSVRVWSAMANVLLDFGDDDGWSGYVGGGVGAASVRYKIDADSVDDIGLDGGSASESDSGFAWQVIAGVRKAISYNLDLGLKYRMFNVGKLEYGDSDGELEGRFRSHSILASLIYNFGAPPAPPPPPVEIPPPPPPATQTCPDGSVILATEVCPAPAVVPAGPFIVFFDWDKSDITPEAAAILDNAAAAYAQTGSAQVMLAGHADRSGSASYNVGLSQRRADAVRAYLAGRGVADGAISTSAFGEERPLVQTEDGVREPQNRRVEITFGPGSGM